jgi:hypothetical protein
MNDLRAHSLVAKRIKYNRMALAAMVFCLSILVSCKSDAQSFIFVVGGTLGTVYSGLRSYTELLAEGQSYHVLSGLRLTKKSSLGVIVFCVAFELAIVGFLNIFFAVRASSNC